MRRAAAIAIFVAVMRLAMVAPSAMAQAQRGSIRGEARDPAGAVLPQAHVTAKNKATGETRETHADPQGYFAFTELVPGKYEVMVSKLNFRPQVKKVEVVAAGNTSVDFKLKPEKVIIE